MPIYEFKCEKCTQRFEELCPLGATCNRCPHCGSERVVKQISAFSACSSGSDGSTSLGAGSCSSCHGGNCHSCH